MPPERNDGLQTCVGPCGHDLPLNEMFFDRDNSRTTGFKNVCKDCRAAERQEKEREQIDERIKKLEKAALLSLDTMLSTGSDIPHMAEMYQRLIEAFGGIGNFAAHFMANYLVAKPGSLQRMKMLETIVRLGTKVSESNAAQIPLELMSDEDVQREVQRQARRYLMIHEPPHIEDANANGTSKKVS